MKALKKSIIIIAVILAVAVLASGILYFFFKPVFYHFLYPFDRITGIIHVTMDGEKYKLISDDVTGQYDFKDEISVKAAASLTANILRSGPMYVQTLLGGMDGDKPSLYSLDPAGGMIEDTYISTGSGSIVAYGVLEDRFRDDLTTDEGIEIAIRAIRAAAERDTFSGNGYLVAKVDKDGFEMLDSEKINEILDKI